MTEYVTNSAVAIAVIGAPGTGKHAFANALRERIRSGKLFQTPLVLESPSASTSDTGERATYLSHVSIATEQYGDEDFYRRDRQSLLVVGTAVQRLAHSAVAVETLRAEADTDIVREARFREQISAQFLHFVLTDTFSYAFTFYLPTPDVDPDDPDLLVKTYNKRVDAKIQEIVPTYQITAWKPEGDTAIQRAQTAYDLLEKRITDAEASRQDQDVPDESDTESALVPDTGAGSAAAEPSTVPKDERELSRVSGEPDVPVPGADTPVS